jgi:DNA-binding response OmpR family regulator
MSGDPRSLLVLFIDDDPGIREYGRWILEREGHRVLEAEDGIKGLKLAESHPIDLLITDLVMPEKEGIETIADIRRLQPGIRIIAISGAIDSESYLQLAGGLGAHATIMKPFNRVKFLETVRQVIGD